MLLRGNLTPTDSNDFTVTYDANGNLIEMTDASFGEEVKTDKMVYTEQNQIPS